MPYKNIEDRRNAWKRWRNKHPEKRKELVRIQNQARYANPIKEYCQVHNCVEIGERHHPDYSKPKEIIWLCKHHHELLHTTVSCSIDGCTNKHLARGMCQKHYSSWRRRK